MVTAMGVLIVASALLIPKMTRTETTENIAIPVSSAKDTRQDALKIVGNWTITTSNQDTTEVSTYKFNNDVTGNGINLLAWLLTPQTAAYRLDHWSIQILHLNALEGCQILEASVAPHKTEFPDMWGKTDWNSGINLAGSCLMEPGVATIDYVGTKVIHSGTPGAMPPVTIFSEKLLEEPIPVSEGQLITVEVEYTFVSG